MNSPLLMFVTHMFIINLQRSNTVGGTSASVTASLPLKEGSGHRGQRFTSSIHRWWWWWWWSL